MNSVPPLADIARASLAPAPQRQGRAAARSRRPSTRSEGGAPVIGDGAALHHRLPGLAGRLLDHRRRLRRDGRLRPRRTSRWPRTSRRPATPVKARPVPALSRRRRGGRARRLQRGSARKRRGRSTATGSSAPRGTWAREAADRHRRRCWRCWRARPCSRAPRTTEAKPGTEYKIVFDNAFGLTKGGDFRVGGVKRRLDQRRSRRSSPTAVPPKAEVTAKITEPGFADFRARRHLQHQAAVADRRVLRGLPARIAAASRSSKDGSGRVPVSQTSSTIPQDLVNNILRRPYTRAAAAGHQPSSAPAWPAARGPPGQVLRARAPRPARDQRRRCASSGNQNTHDRELHR